MTKNKHSVIVVDDYELLSEAIGKLVDEFDEFETTCVLKNGKELIDALKKGKINPDIVLMDVNMPVLNGIETTKILTKEFPEIKVLALSVDDDEATIIQMLRAGAKGYLTKDIQKELLHTALVTLLEQGYFHTQMVTAVLVGNLQKNNGIEELKDREIEFIKLACSDLTYKEIADKMFLSPKTIDNYRDSVFVKLNVRNRVGLVLFAIKNKIFDIDQVPEE